MCASWGSLKGMLGSNIQHRAVNSLKSLAHPQIAGILCRSHIIALDLFCCHCKSIPYLRGITFLQLCPVIQRSLRKSDLCKLSQMVVKKIKIDKEAISEILVADTDSESVNGPSNVEYELEEAEENSSRWITSCNKWQRITNQHTVRFLLFADNSKGPDQSEEYDQLWKLRTVFYTLKKAYAEFYNPLKNLEMDKGNIKLKGTVIFRQHIPKKRKCFSIKLYRLCDESGYTYDMRVYAMAAFTPRKCSWYSFLLEGESTPGPTVPLSWNLETLTSRNPLGHPRSVMGLLYLYLGKDTHSATDTTATHATVKHMTRRVEDLGHTIFMDNLFSSLRLFDDLNRCEINSCRTVRPNRKDMRHDFGLKQTKVKRSDARLKTRGGLTALVWKDRREVYMLTNTDPPPAEGNFCDNSNRPMKPHSVEWYNWHMGYIDNSHHMANSNLMNRHSFKWTMKLSFHLMDLTELNSSILLSLFGAKYAHQDFKLLLVTNLIEKFLFLSFCRVLNEICSFLGNSPAYEF